MVTPYLAILILIEYFSFQSMDFPMVESLLEDLLVPRLSKDHSIRPWIINSK